MLSNIYITSILQSSIGISSLTTSLARRLPQESGLVVWKIADFGIARVLRRNAYGVYNARTQIGTEMWSLGVVMSFYCNRRHLFGNVPSVLRWEGGRSTLVRRHEYSIDLRQLIADLLGPIAHSRPTAIRVLQECDKNGRQDLFAQYGIPRVYYLCS